MIRYDRSNFTIVVACDCGWQDLVITQQAAWTIALEHETRCHPDSWQVRDAANHRKNRALRR